MKTRAAKSRRVFLFKAQFLPSNGATEVKPFLYDWNRDGIIDLFLGQRNGRVLYYNGVSSPFSGTFVLAQSEFGNVRVGAVSATAIVDLNGDAADDLLVGEEAGGLNYYINREGTNVTHSSFAPNRLALHVYPNPFREELRIALRAPLAQTPYVKIYAVTGALMAELPLQKMNAELWESRWRNATTALSAGIYFMQAGWGQQRLTQKNYTCRSKSLFACFLAPVGNGRWVEVWAHDRWLREHASSLNLMPFTSSASYIRNKALWELKNKTQKKILKGFCRVKRNSTRSKLSSRRKAFIKKISVDSVFTVFNFLWICAAALRRQLSACLKSWGKYVRESICLVGLASFGTHTICDAGTWQLNVDERACA